MHGFGGPRRVLAQETERPTSVRATLGRLVGYFRPYWAVLLVVAILIAGSTYVQVLTPRLTGQTVDCYLTPATASRFMSGFQQLPGMENVQTAAETNCWFPVSVENPTAADYAAGLGKLILLIAGLYALGSVMSGLQFYLMSWSGQHVLKSLRVRVFNHLHRLSMSYHTENEAGNLMSRITNDMDTLQQAISFVLVQVTSGALLLIWVAVTMLRTSVEYALISMVMVPFMFLATWWFSGQARRAFRRTRTAIGDVNADLQESIAGVREVQAFGREEANIESFRAVNAANRDANIRAVAFTAALSPTLEAMGYAAMAITIIAGGLALLRGQTLGGTVISLGLVITFLQYVQRFNQPIAQISVMWTNLQSAVAGAERIFGLLDSRPEVQERAAAQRMPSIQGRVAFDQVEAAYKPGIPVLRDLSFQAEPGETVAIVGPTGAGKTTIINLIPRFYDVVGGAVRIDGLDVRDVALASLRQQIGIVLQDTFLFSDTVLNNIRFGRPDASDEEVQAAAHLARADDFIQRLPEGYNTLLGERGSGVSQGQRQLIAIARAALADPRILILDEATSSVDTRTERQIQVALDELLQGRTSFVIAHRLSTIRNADQVLVLEEGQIVERAKSTSERSAHEQLLDHKGEYHTLYTSQFRQQQAPAAPTPGGDGRPVAVPTGAAQVQTRHAG
jgi:ATP-binding cassette subfamily B multidrug efflux pump